jgi:hypothetical protein
VNPTIQIIAVAGSIGVMLVVFELIRRRKLREEYSFLWFAASLGLIVLSVWRELLHELARLVGVDYPPSVLLLGGIVLGFCIALHFSISLSRLADQNKRLAQEVALLRHALGDAVERPAERADAPAPTRAPARSGQAAGLGDAREPA